MATQFDEDKWRVLVKAAFDAAGLPEVDEKDLETGTYTNKQIAERFRDRPKKLIELLISVTGFGSEAERRSILSFVVDGERVKA